MWQQAGAGGGQVDDGSHSISEFQQVDDFP